MTLALSILEVLAAPAGTEGGGGTERRNQAADTEARRASDERERIWVAGIRRGDPDAFRAVMEAYFEHAVRFAFGFVRERDVAEDVAQEVFARIWARRDEWTPQTSVRAYVLGAVRNRALDVLKHRGVEARHVELERSFMDGGEAVGNTALERAADLKVLYEAVAELPERRRMALMLRYEHGLSHAEVGAALGVTAKAAKELIVRTLDGLRIRLSGRI